MNSKASNILIVDDQMENRTLLEAYLEELPVSIDEAASGPEALKKLREREYVMVLLDVQMPGMDGFQVLETMRSEPALADVPVIFVSAISNSDEHIIRGITGGAVDFIPKPVNGTILTSKVSNFISMIEKQKKLDQLVKKLERTNQRLKENEHKFKRITQSASDGIILLNASGDIRFWNVASSRIFGYNKFELLGESFRQTLIAPKSHAALEEHFEALRNSQNRLLQPIRITAIKQNGLEFPVELSLGLFQTADNETNYTVIVRDMTQRDKMEKEAQEARELRESNKVIKEFMDNVSHEMRTPMNAIIGISNMFLKYQSDNLTEKQKEGLTMIQQSGTRLLDMINDVLDISRIESHKVMVQLEAFNPDELLATIRSMVLSLIESKPIKFRIQKSPSVPDTLVSDPKKLQQILINLLSNAVKFTPEGRIHLNLHYKDSQLHVEVEDSGIGIAPDAHSKIFQRFQQIDNTASKEYQGTGLGLHIVSKLLELLGGGISVESQPQTGTIMRFWVPVSSPDTHDASLQERSYSRKISWYGLDDSNKKLALIVDSNLNHQFLFTNLLREANFRFVSCYDAHHGLLLTNELLPDLLILNMEMPKVQGVPYLDRLKQTNDHLRLPILAFTSIENPHFNIQGLTLELYKGILEESRLLTAIQNLSLIENAPKICNWLYLYEHAELPKNMLPSGAACFKNEHPETARLAIERRFVQHLLLDGLSSEGPNLQLIETLILHHHRMPDLILISDDPNPLRSVSLQNLPYRQITSTDLARAGTLEAALLTLHPPKL